MITYAGQLVAPTPQGIASYPWQWLINQVPIPYLTVVGSVYDASMHLVSSHTTVAFQGAMNPALLYLCLPATAYAVYMYWKLRDQTALFCIVSFVFTYGPYYPLALTHRITYIFYFLSALPSLAMLASLLLIRIKINRMLVLAYLAVVLLGFAFLFPFRVLP
jgi:hypothetical protein